MKQRVQIIGSYLSPYVCKVLVVFDLKGIPYEVDPIVSFFGNECYRSDWSAVGVCDHEPPRLD